MKALHRTKAIETYQGARLTLKAGLGLPAYMMLKECARATLAYIVEESLDTDISEKSKLSNLVDLSPDTIVTDKDKELISILLGAEKEGLSSIMALTVEELQPVKKMLKKYIGEYLNEKL